MLMAGFDVDGDWWCVSRGYREIGPGTARLLWVTSMLQTRAILIWILIQLIALGLGAMGIPLWPNHPVPRESLSIQEMTIIQIAVVAMVFPLVLANFWTAVAVIAMVWPFQQFAGLLSNTPQKYLILSGSYVSLWMSGLWLLGGMIRSTANQLAVICVAQCIAIGGVILWYLHLESSRGNAGKSEMFGPVLGVISIVNGTKISWIGWTEAAIPLLLGVGCGVFRQSRQRRNAPVP
jgi:hypothetical protein